MKKLTDFFIRVYDFVRYDIWHITGNELSRSRQVLYNTLKTLVLAIRGFNADQLSVKASALTYSILFAIIPMVALVISIAKGFGLEGLIVAYQGAVIADIASGKLLRDVRMPCADAAEMCSFLHGLGRHIHVYDGDDVYMNRDDEMKRYYEAVCGVSGILTEEDIAKTVVEKAICPQKVLAMNEKEENQDIKNRGTTSRKTRKALSAL